jgi:hypothetical protein
MKMKTILFMMFTVLSLSAPALEVKISRMKVLPGLERSFLLETSLSERVVLDCQSFLQGLFVGQGEQEFYIMLEPYECEELSSRMKKTLRKRQKHCLDLEEYLRADYACY